MAQFQKISPMLWFGGEAEATANHDENRCQCTYLTAMAQAQGGSQGSLNMCTVTDFKLDRFAWALPVPN